MAWEEKSCICLHMQLIAILSRIGVNSVTCLGNGAFYDCNFPNNLKQELISRFGNEIFD